ncbi:MAG: hypothetical protein ACJAS1_003665 [Oleiphilaceae bacterium]|jgi:hypothetical protein
MTEPANLEFNFELIYPANVQADLDNGFRITDTDDGFWRAKTHSKTAFQFRVEHDGITYDEMIDLREIDAEDKLEAVSPFYNSMKELRSEHGINANFKIAECYFEYNLLLTN